MDCSTLSQLIGKWVIGNGTTGPMSIPAPATKADAIKLLEVFK